MTDEHFTHKMEQNQIEQSMRLQRLIKILNFNQSKFAKSLGITQPNISRMINGENKISTEVLNRIAIAHKNVNLHWLLAGEGEMFIIGPNEKPAQVEGGNDVTGKGRLEDLEERVERLEEAMKQWMKDIAK